MMLLPPWSNFPGGSFVSGPMFLLRGLLCPRVFLPREVSVWGVSVQGGGLCLAGLCPEGLCLGVSVQGISVRENPSDRDHHTLKSGRYAFYWIAFLLIIKCAAGRFHYSKPFK